MSLFDDLDLGLNVLTIYGGDTITIAGIVYPAVVTSMAIGDEFMPGVMLEKEIVSALLSKSKLSTKPALQSVVTYAGKNYRVELAKDNPTSFSLGLTSLVN